MKKKQTREMLNGLFEKLTPIFADDTVTAYSDKIQNGDTKGYWEDALNKLGRLNY